MTIVEQLRRDHRAPLPYAAVRQPLVWLTIQDAMLRARIAEVFSRAGYSIVDLAEPARLSEALAIATGPAHQMRLPTVAVIDLDPIASDPVELLTSVRAEAPGLPLIALIDDTDIAVFERASRLDINVLFVKPFELELLRTAAMTFASI